MQQFNAYWSPNRSIRNAYPYIADIQSPLISEVTIWIVIPLDKLW